MKGDDIMAIIKGFIKEKNNISVRSNTVADYTFDEEYLQIRSYKDKDFNIIDSSKQNIQLDRVMAKELKGLIDEFLDQN